MMLRASSVSSCLGVIAWAMRLMFTSCSGRGVRMIQRMLKAVAPCRQRAIARAVDTIFRRVSIASRHRWNTGLAFRSVVLIRNDRSTCHIS